MKKQFVKIAAAALLVVASVLSLASCATVDGMKEDVNNFIEDNILGEEETLSVVLCATEGVVVPVEVDRAKIEVLTSSKNIFEGSTFTFNAPDCDEKCDFHDLCFPDGLIENDKCIVLNNDGKHKENCKKGYQLNKLTLGFVI